MKKRPDPKARGYRAFACVPLEHAPGERQGYVSFRSMYSVVFGVTRAGGELPVTGAPYEPGGTSMRTSHV